MAPPTSSICIHGCSSCLESGEAEWVSGAAGKWLDDARIPAAGSSSRGEMCCQSLKSKARKWVDEIVLAYLQLGALHLADLELGEEEHGAAACCLNESREKRPAGKK
ncbi:uncharacterized protein LOC100828514 isoform X2 [Brachypodium distachyon]|uniref:uncharacterized protein LOC100828514 isoform X2 n=1 Tax=Brachypodium distachyon TaxID=15368 RepID=UPI0005300B60|nr:uncharacterized protein LOC100828514 isoform X2 [Brachypodium distachyon]|eukprot:XP_024317415.1 uncharacterized protein LOC100828514 isoform X2 [Brachypodium distachyon]